MSDAAKREAPADVPRGVSSAYGFLVSRYLYHKGVQATVQVRDASGRILHTEKAPV